MALRLNHTLLPSNNNFLNMNIGNKLQHYSPFLQHVFNVNLLSVNSILEKNYFIVGNLNWNCSFGTQYEVHLSHCQSNCQINNAKFPVSYIKGDTPWHWHYARVARKAPDA